jgi:uncharacterized membrane protein YhaH (DUF805 family)
MGSLASSVRCGLNNIANFSGRDSRIQFWPYCLCIVACLFLVNFIYMAPRVVLMIVDVLLAGPSGSTPVRGVDTIRDPVWNMSLAAFAILFLASAVTRRLHDLDKTGLWGLMPLPVLAFGQYTTSQVFDRDGSALALALETFAMKCAINMLYVGLLVVLVVMLSRPGTLGPNRFGGLSPLEPGHEP